MYLLLRWTNRYYLVWDTANQLLGYTGEATIPKAIASFQENSWNTNNQPGRFTDRLIYIEEFDKDENTTTERPIIARFETLPTIETHPELFI